MKIPPEERKIIWERYEEEDISQKELARQYGVTQGAISLIIRSNPDYISKTKEWIKPIGKARGQFEITKEGFEKVIVYAREEGMSVRAIAEAAGMTHAQIQRILKRRMPKASKSLTKSGANNA